MPTKPLESILYRELSIVQAREYIDLASGLLKELVNYSTNLFARCGDSAKGEENEDAAVFVLFLHMIEITDGIEILVSNASGIPAIPLLRSAFEANLSMEYILESDDQYVRRSLSWLAAYVLQSTSTYEMLNPNAPRGKEFYRNLENEGVLKRIELPEIKPVENAVDRFRSVLSRPQFEDINLERERNRRGTPWYGLFDGPKNLHDLALHLGKVGQYDFLYRKWSSIAHALDFSRFASVSDKGEQYIKQLRNPKDLNEIMNFAPTFILSAIRLMTAKFRPSEAESQRRWYLNEIQERYHRFT